MIRANTKLKKKYTNKKYTFGIWKDNVPNVLRI